MFYAVEAILLSKSLSFRKHSGAIGAFGKEFVKNGVFPDKLHRYISDAFDIRQAADYGTVGSVSEEKARSLIAQAKEFVESIKEYLKKEGQEI